MLIFHYKPSILGYPHDELETLICGVDMTSLGTTVPGYGPAVTSAMNGNFRFQNCRSCIVSSQMFRVYPLAVPLHALALTYSYVCKWEKTHVLRELKSLQFYDEPGRSRSQKVTIYIYTFNIYVYIYIYNIRRYSVREKVLSCRSFQTSILRDWFKMKFGSHLEISGSELFVIPKSEGDFRFFFLWFPRQKY